MTHRIVVTSVYLAVLSSALADPPGEVVLRRIDEAIRWQAYWEGAAAVGQDYRVGERVDVRILLTPTHLYAFLAPIRLEIDMALSSDGQVTAVTVIGSSAPTNDDAVARFLGSGLRGNPGCSGDVSVRRQTPSEPAKNGGTIPLARPCTTQAEVLDDKSLTVVLPKLTPPDAIQNKILPPGRSSLARAVERYLRLRLRSCGLTTVSIPYYSNNDPRVYVLMRPRGNCPRGVVAFSRAPDGRWESGKFLADFPKEEISSIIERIESNTALNLTRYLR